MARVRQPGSAAMAVMNTLVPAEARFSARARTARRPGRARAVPREAETRAGGSGVGGSRGGVARGAEGPRAARGHDRAAGAAGARVHRVHQRVPVELGSGTRGGVDAVTGRRTASGRLDDPRLSD